MSKPSASKYMNNLIILIHDLTMENKPFIINELRHCHQKYI